MNLYTAVLFVHAIAVLMLTAALTMEAWTVMQLRRAASPSAAGPWTEATQSIAIAAISSLVIIYATGAWLTESLRSWAYAWPRFAVLEIVLFAFFGAFSGVRMRTIRRYAASEKANLPEWNALTHSVLLKVSLSTRIWIVIGTVLLTAAKPGPRESLVIVASSLILGLLFSFVPLGNCSTVSTAQAGSR
jgi:hypothetical protein